MPPEKTVKKPARSKVEKSSADLVEVTVIAPVYLGAATIMPTFNATGEPTKKINISTRHLPRLLKAGCVKV